MGSTELLEDADSQWRFERTVERTEVREPFLAETFSLAEVNERLSQGEHEMPMYQQY